MLKGLTRGTQILVFLSFLFLVVENNMFWLRKTVSVPCPEAIAVQNKLKAPVDLLVLVLSTLPAKEEREFLREMYSCCHPHTLNVQVWFVLDVMDKNETVIESNHYSDLIYTPEATNYQTLTKKTLFALTFAATQTARYVFKTDDDSFVNVTNLWSGISTACPNDCNNLYYGRLVQNYQVEEDAKHKWHNAEYLAQMGGVNKYAPYMQGAGYVLSHSLVSTLMLTNRDSGLVFTPIEDASVGLWLAPLNVHRVDSVGIMHNQHILQPLKASKEFIVWDDMCFQERVNEKKIEVMHKMTLPMMRWVSARPRRCEAEKTLYHTGLKFQNARVVRQQYKRHVVFSIGTAAGKFLIKLMPGVKWELVEFVSVEDASCPAVFTTCTVGGSHSRYNSQEIMSVILKQTKASDYALLNIGAKTGMEFEITENIVNTGAFTKFKSIFVHWDITKHSTKTLWPHQFKQILNAAKVAYFSDHTQLRYSKHGKLINRTRIHTIQH